MARTRKSKITYVDDLDTSTPTPNPTPTPTQTYKESTVSGDTFSFDFKPVENYKRDTTNRTGRVRKPSPYDVVWNDLLGADWQIVEIESPEHKAAVVKALKSSQKFFNTGLDLDVKHDTQIAFRVRDLRPRRTRAESDAAAAK